MEKNIQTISQVLATVRGTLADHQEIQRAWGEVVEQLKPVVENEQATAPKETKSK